MNCISKIDEERSDLGRLYSNEILGIQATTQCLCSDKERQEAAFIKHVQNTTKLMPNGRLQVKMPWKPEFPESLPNNRERAEQQLMRREKQVKRDGKLESYNREIRDLVDRQVVRILNPEEIHDDEPAWYLNHRCIERPDKASTSLRLVFDSAAEYQGRSLNKALEKGPDYLNNLFSSLLAWREAEIAFTGDIGKMFNQIEIHPDDQRFHRFLWRNGKEQEEPSAYQWLRVPFGDKPSPDLAGYCIKLLAEENKITHAEAHAILTEHIYVDDICHSEPTVQQAKQAIQETETVLQKGSFPIKGWHSNVLELDQAHAEERTDVLGLTWDKRNDNITLKHKEIADMKVVTKRTVLGMISKFWDPIGMVTPVMMKYKVALQRLWANGYDWDTPSPTEEENEWRRNRSEMLELYGCEVSRCLKADGAIGKPQLHGFADAGSLAYGGCCFIRWTVRPGEHVLKFVASKALVAPLKRQSIPRLELMGCLVMSRLVKSVENATKIQFDSKYLWTDPRYVPS